MSQTIIKKGDPKAVKRWHRTLSDRKKIDELVNKDKKNYIKGRR